MFCDLVNSTVLSGKLDPEELREVIRAYQGVCAVATHRFGGCIAQYIGDGLMIYFGYPQAHEDDAQRAVRAGLDIATEIPRLNAQLRQTVEALYEVPLQVRIGIHTGLVVIGEMGFGEKRDPMAIIGETPNIAARVQSIAAPNTVVISATTYQLIEGLFECSDLGPQPLKGVSRQVQVYCVVSESEAQSRFEVAASAGLTPLVGRKQEVGFLAKRWEKVKDGAGQVVLLRGEPGIGKSRLVRELRERVAQEDHRWLECRCSPYYQNSALYPVIELLQRLFQFSRDDSAQEKLNKLEGALVRHGFALEEGVPLLAALLSLPLLDRYRPLSLTPQRQRQKTLEVLLALLLEKAEKRPVLSVWEDLHWADPSTLELLSLLIDRMPTARILVLLSFRPEFHSPWATRSHLFQLMLSPLSRKQTETMVERVTGGKHLPPGVLKELIAKSDGIPLVVEELTKTVLGAAVDTHGQPYLSTMIPPTLHDSLTARLDRLGTAKEIAQLGATLGREFTYELLQAVAPADEANLQRALAQLVDAEVLYRRGLPPQARYFFKHALIQDAAYESLLKSQRRQYHKQIAEVLQERFPENVEAHPELLARHYTEAGLAEQAIPYWQRAGQRAIERSANQEAINHLTKGLELLKTLPDTPERAQQELLLQTTLGSVLMATKGFAAPEVEKGFTRARELCRQIGEVPQLFPVLRGLASFYSVRPDYKTSQELGEQCLRLAQLQQDPLLLLGAHMELGATLFYVGEFTQALKHLEQGITLYDPEKHRSHAFLYGQDFGVSCLSRASHVLWFLGYPDQALKKSQEALALAQELSHPFSLAYTLVFAALLWQLCRNGQAAQEQAEAAVTLSTDQGFPNWVASGIILRGWALATQGQAAGEIAQMLQSLAAWRAAGAESALPYFLALLAETYEKGGQPTEGLSVLAEALAIAHTNGEHCYEAELYRLKGQLTLQQFQVSGFKFQVSENQKSKIKSQKSKIADPRPLTPDPQAEAEGCFLKAIEIARRQQAKSLKLRAVMSLSRLWLSQGKKEEARKLLAEIYGWFTEGFDTADLQEARALLEEVS
jgi:predicted ATPase/class 3 adenylate cyclase